MQKRFEDQHLHEVSSTGDNSNSIIFLDDLTKGEAKPKEILNQDTFVAIKKKAKIRNNKPIMEAYRYLYDYDYEPGQITIKVEDDKGQMSSDNSFISDIPVTLEEEEKESATQILPTRVKDEEYFGKNEFGVKNEYQKVKCESFGDWVKNEFNVKSEYIKKEYLKMKRENRGEDDFMYILDDDDDEVSFVGAAKRKLKFEEEDIKGTLIEGIEDFDKVNTAKDGELVELKEFKPWNPLTKQRAQIVDKSKEFFVCQTGVRENLNKHITEPLETIMKAYEAFKDKHRMYMTFVIRIVTW